MDSNNRFPLRQLPRLLAVLAILAIALAGCGGAGGVGSGGGTSSNNAGSSAAGQTIQASILSRINGTNYVLNVYLPPPTAGARSDLPVVYMLDGESWFQTLVDITESTQNHIIIVGINSMGQRARDYVPLNSCTDGGGGNTAYFNFIRQELIPYVEATFGGNPNKRALFGHSHGGSFVLYAMFSEAPDQHTFKAYLASDSALQCLWGAATRWEQDYAAAYRDLPVRLHLSFVPGGNSGTNDLYADVITQRNYARLTLVSAPTSGTHTSIVPTALAQGVPFAFANSP